MKQLLLIAWTGALGVIVAGCDTALEGEYKPYESKTPAAALWPTPESADAQPAAYREAPTTVPTTMPADQGG